jgi:hypothetical protein
MPLIPLSQQDASGWNSDVFEDTAFSLGGQRSVKIVVPASDGTPRYRRLWWSTPIPINNGDIFCAKFSGATSVDISAVSSCLRFHAYFTDTAMSFFSLGVDATIQPASINQWISTALFFKPLNATFKNLLFFIEAYQSAAGGPAYTGWLDAIEIRRVMQAAHYSSTAQTIAASSITALTWATKIADVGDVISSGVYTGYQPGMHTFRASVSLDSLNAAKTMTAYLYVNGVSVWSKAITTVAGTNTIPFCMSVLLNSGDTVDVRVQHNDTSSRSTSTDDQLSYFIGQRVS